MKSKVFPYIIALAALAVSLSAAFYSVYGLGKLFAGASLQVMIMAGSLEFAKLVIASALYQYWSTINKVLRGYLIVAIIVLMTITSAGIYGYLSGAYQQTYAGTEVVNRQVSVIEARKHSFEEQRSQYITEKEQLTGSITQLRTAISNPGQTQYIDKKTGQVITNTSSSARTLLQKELNTAVTERDRIDSKIQALNDSISSADIKVIELKNSDSSVRELGPLMYLSNLTGMPMDKVINWYLLLIIFVFDPLAISLVVIANQAFSKSKPKPQPEKTFEEAIAEHPLMQMPPSLAEHWEVHPNVTYTVTSSSRADDFPYDDEYMANIWYPNIYDNVKPTVVTGSAPIETEATRTDKVKVDTSKRPAYWASK